MESKRKAGVAFFSSKESLKSLIQELVDDPLNSYSHGSAIIEKIKSQYSCLDGEGREKIKEYVHAKKKSDCPPAYVVCCGCLTCTALATVLCITDPLWKVTVALSSCILGSVAAIESCYDCTGANAFNYQRIIDTFENIERIERAEKLKLV